MSEGFPVGVEVLTNNDLAIYYLGEPINMTYLLRINEEVERFRILNAIPKNFKIIDVEGPCRILKKDLEITPEGRGIISISLLLEANEPGEYRLEPKAIVLEPKSLEYSLGLITIKVKPPKTSLSLELSHMAIQEGEHFSVSYALFNSEERPLLLSKIKGIPPEPEKFECVSQTICPISDEIIYHDKRVEPNGFLHGIITFKALEEGQYFFDPIAIGKLREAKLELRPSEPRTLVVRKTKVTREFKSGISEKELVRIMRAGTPIPGVLIISIVNPFREELRIKEISLNAHGEIGEAKTSIGRITADKLVLEKTIDKGEFLEVVIETPEATQGTIVFPTARIEITGREYVIPLDPVKIR